MQVIGLPPAKVNWEWDLESFMFFFCLVFVMLLCASFYSCLVVTCWERAGQLALVCGV